MSTAAHKRLKGADNRTEKTARSRSSCYSFSDYLPSRGEAFLGNSATKWEPSSYTSPCRTGWGRQTLGTARNRTWKHALCSGVEEVQAFAGTNIAPWRTRRAHPFLSPLQSGFPSSPANHSCCKRTWLKITELHPEWSPNILSLI